MKKIIFGIIVVLAIGAGIWRFFPIKTGQVEKTGVLDSFARCLASKKITMYGAKWCAHCQSEKKAFGDSFKYVPYVECPDEIKTCVDLGIQGYPTWILPDGKKLIGEQGLEKLSKESGCPLPKTD